MSARLDLDGWLPVTLRRAAEGPMVDWCYLGDDRLTDPFFDDTIARRLADPFSMLFRHHTPLDVLAELAASLPGVPPAGFIFHQTRCGSTLVSQLLAARPEHVVVSEASVVAAALDDRRWPELAATSRMERLGWLLSALGRRPAGDATSLFVKFDGWHTGQLAAIHEAYPTVPWVFVFRHPYEILVSHQEHPGSLMLPGVIGPSAVGLDESAWLLEPEAYRAEVVRSLGEAALEAVDGGLLVDYRDLPEAFDTIAAHFGLDPDVVGIERHGDVVGRDAKAPGRAFVPDSAAKQARVTPALRRVAEGALATYEQLAARAAQGAAGRVGSGRVTSGAVA